MAHGFRTFNDRKAQGLLLDDTDAAAQRALATLHECYLDRHGLYGKPSCDISTDQPLDLYALYSAVYQVFLTWNDEPLPIPTIPSELQKALKVRDASQFVSMIPDAKLKKVSSNLLSMLVAQAVTKATAIDLLFCCRFVAHCFERPGVLDGVLSGSNAEPEGDWLDGFAAQ